MRKQLLVLLITAYSTFATAQQNYRMHFGFQGGLTNGINMFNSNNYTSNLYAGPIGGVYADFCLYKRLWLFSSFNIGYGAGIVKNRQYDEFTYSQNSYVVGLLNTALAYRISKEEKPWQLYPYIGFADLAFWSPLAGVECNREFKTRGNIAFGLNWTFDFVGVGTPYFRDQIGILNLYGKIGFGVLKRKK